MSSYDSSPDPPSELVERLRRMRWPEPSLEARRRCWEALRREMSARPGAVGPADLEEAPAGDAADGDGAALLHLAPVDPRDAPSGPRHDFAARGFDGRYSGALGERVAAARGGMRVALGVR